MLALKIIIQGHINDPHMAENQLDVLLSGHSEIWQHLMQSSNLGHKKRFFPDLSSVVLSAKVGENRFPT